MKALGTLSYIRKKGLETSQQITKPEKIKSDLNVSAQQSQNDEVKDEQIQQDLQRPQLQLKKTITIKNKELDEDDAVLTLKQDKKTVITQLFNGILRTQIICQNCHTEYSNYEKFCTLSIPLPQSEQRPVYFKFVPRITKQTSFDNLSIKSYAVIISKYANIKQFLRMVAKLINRKISALMVATVYNNKIDKVIQSDKYQQYRIRMLMSNNTELQIFQTLSLAQAKLQISPFQSLMSSNNNNDRFEQSKISKNQKYNHIISESLTDINADKNLMFSPSLTSLKSKDLKLQKSNTTKKPQNPTGSKKYYNNSIYPSQQKSKSAKRPRLSSAHGTQDQFDRFPKEKWLYQQGYKVDYYNYRVQKWEAVQIVEVQSLKHKKQSTKKIKIKTHNGRNKFSTWVAMSKDAVLVKPLYTETQIPAPHLIRLQVMMRELIPNTNQNKTDNKHHQPRSQYQQNQQNQKKFKPLGTPFLITVGSWFSLADVRREVENQLKKYIAPSAVKEKMFQTFHVGQKLKGQENVHELENGMKRVQNPLQSQKHTLISGHQNQNSKTQSKSHNTLQTNFKNDAQITTPRGQIQTLDNTPILPNLSKMTNMYLMEATSYSTCCAYCKTIEVSFNCQGCRQSNFNSMNSRIMNIEWISGFLQRPTIMVQWQAKYYQDPVEQKHSSYLQGAIKQQQLKKGIKLQSCLQTFIKQEEIDDFECQECKERIKAKIQIRLADVPPILIVHLKRFSFRNGVPQKIQDLVNCSLKGIDLTKYIFNQKELRHQQSSNINISSQQSQQQQYMHDQQHPPNSLQYMYDLYGVVNHINFGGYGGHYTANILPSSSILQESPSKLNTWYNCNDANIKQIQSPKQIVPPTAYILFLKRRQFPSKSLVELLQMSNI